MHSGMIRGEMTRRSWVAALLLLSLGGCSPETILGSDTLPPDVPDPAQVGTPDGALSAYRGAAVMFASAFGGSANNGGFVLQSGVLTDEIGESWVGLVGLHGSWTPLDARTLPEGATTPTNPTDNVYVALQRARGQISQALGAMRAYAPTGTAMITRSAPFTPSAALVVALAARPSSITRSQARRL